MARTKEVGGPLPDIPGHVIEPVAVRRKRADRRRAYKPVEPHVLPGEAALPGVRHWFAARELLIAPREDRSLKPAAGGKLPLRFRRQILLGPRGVGCRVFVGDVHNRMLVAPVAVAARTFGMLPRRAAAPVPPAPYVIQSHRAGRSGENERAR